MSTFSVSIHICLNSSLSSKLDLGESNSTLESIPSEIIGTWWGCASFSGDNWGVQITFNDDGTYAVYNIDTELNGGTLPSGQYLYPPLYFGTSGSSPSKTYRIDGFSDYNGIYGWLSGVYGEYEAGVSFVHMRASSDGMRLAFDVWYVEHYTPIVYKLTRL